MSMTAQAQAYRPLMTLPGESLLLARDSVAFMVRLLEFSESTGVPADELLFDPIVSIPLPVYPASFEQSRRRWATVRPEAMWHPLLWLPESLAGRFPLEVTKADGTVITGVESDAAWAVRVAIELEASRLYDSESGMWLDVLSVAGLDITDPAVVARVDRWLAGAADEVLDSIDLSGYLMDDDELVVRDAAENLPALRRSSWAALSLDLLNQLDLASDSADGPRLDTVYSLACLGSAMNLGAGSSVPAEATVLWESAAQMCGQLRDEDATIDRDWLDQLALALQGELFSLHSAHRAWLQELDG